MRADHHQRDHLRPHRRPSQQNSSFQQSLLVSAYQPCQSPYPDHNLSEYSLKDYLRSMDNQHHQHSIEKTEVKIRRGNGRKMTEPDGDELADRIMELEAVIRSKDERIGVLERSLARAVGKAGTLPTMAGTPQGEKLSGVAGQREKERAPKITVNSQAYQKRDSPKHPDIDTLVANYNKQIKFLTFNNQQLYEQLSAADEQNKTLQQQLQNLKQYKKGLECNLKELSQKNHSLQKLNKVLLREKQQMIERYEEEAAIFDKMQQVWQQGLARSRPRSTSAKAKPRADTRQKISIADLLRSRLELK